MPSVNGCGPEGSTLKFPQGVGAADFTAACNAHDICYETCNSTKSACDADLTTAARAACMVAYPRPTGDAQDEDRDRRGICLSRARTYGSAVSAWGKAAYDAAQKTACECCRRVAVRGRLIPRTQMIAPFVTAEINDDGFTIELPSPVRDGSFAVANLAAGGASSVSDTRTGCLQPSLAGAWDEFQATNAVIMGSILTIEGVKVTPAITRGVGEGDCGSTSITEAASSSSVGLQILLPSEVLGGALTAPVTFSDSGWTWTFTP